MPLKTTRTKNDSAFTPLKLSIDQILHVIKHQPWVRLPNPNKRDPDPLEAGGHYSFHDIQGHITLNCLGLRRLIEDLVQRGYLDEFVFNLEEDPKVGDTPDEAID